MSVEYKIKTLKVFPCAKKVKEYSCERTEILAQNEYKSSFNRERILDKILEKSGQGEAGYEFSSKTMRQQIANRLCEIIKEKYEKLFLDLGYDIDFKVINYNDYYHQVSMLVVWNNEQPVYESKHR